MPEAIEFILAGTVAALALVVAVLSVRILLHAETTQENLKQAARDSHRSIERLAEKLIADQGTLTNHSRERVPPTRQKTSVPVQYTQNPWIDPDATSETGPGLTIGGARPS